MKKIFFIVIGVLLIGVVSIKASELIESSQVLYKDNNTVSTALDELFQAVDIYDKLGETDISGVGDGTVTGAISELSGLTDSSTIRYDSNTDTIQVRVGSKWVSVYPCGVNEGALIPLMTSNAAPKNKVTASNGATDAYKAFGNLPAVASSGNGYNFVGYSVGTTGALTFTYEFDMPVNVTKVELIPYMYRGVSNYTTYPIVTYSIYFIHEDGTETLAHQFKTTSAGYGSVASPSSVYSLHSSNIEKDNTYVKSIKIAISGYIFNYDNKTYVTSLNYFQAYGTVAY